MFQQVKCINYFCIVPYMRKAISDLLTYLIETVGLLSHPLPFHPKSLCALYEFYKEIAVFSSIVSFS